MKNTEHFKHYPEGVKHTIDPDEFTSAVDFLEKKLSEFSDLDGYMNMGKSLHLKKLILYLHISQLISMISDL